MSCNRISNKTFFEKVNSNYKQNQKLKENDYDSFSGNLKKKEKQEIAENLGKEKSEYQRAAELDYRFGKIATELLIQNSGRLEMDAVIKVSARHIRYEECDHVKVCIAEGYTLKAQVKAAEHRVYVEQKNEDGTAQGYEINPLKVSEDTKNPVELMALEAWKVARKAWNHGMFTEIEGKNNSTEKAADAKEAVPEEELTFENMLEQFREFVEKRIKEGSPKILIGGAEFSKEEWESLLKRIDKDIDAYKEELRERIKKKEEKEALKRASESAAEEPDRDTIEIAHGSSFLARMSGKIKAPYSYLADENGFVNYKGVIFVCDDKKQQISLGDISNPKDVLTIPLAKGGCLKVNRNCLDDLATAIRMFSPEDIGRIMRAIAQDKKVKEAEFEIFVAESGKSC